MTKSKKLTFSYNPFHTIIFSQALVPIVIYVMNHISGDYSGSHKLAQVVGEAFFLTLFILINRCFYKLEKKDEMVQYNLAKANKITLGTLCAVLFVGILLGEKLIPGLICSDFCWLSVMGAIALRSLLFTLFDAPKKEDMDDEEE